MYINNEAQTPVYYDNFTVAATTSNVIEINAYYPYGMVIPALSIMATPDKWNGQKFSGKELETALNLGWLDFHKRPYDPTIGRTPTPDPHTENYYYLSPYSMFGNNPVNNIDPDGMDWYSYMEDYEDENGEMQQRTQYMYHRGTMSKEEMEKGGYTHLGLTYNTGDTYYSLEGAAIGYDTNNSMSMSMVSQLMQNDNLNIASINAMGGDFWNNYSTLAESGRITTITDGLSKSSALAGGEHFIGPGLVLLGTPIRALKPVGALGSKPGSSIASYTLSKVFPQKFTNVLGKQAGTKIATTVGTNTIGRAIGRFVPYVGWGLTTYDAVTTSFRLGQQYGPSTWYGSDNTKWFK